MPAVWHTQSTVWDPLTTTWLSCSLTDLQIQRRSGVPAVSLPRTGSIRTWHAACNALRCTTPLAFHRGCIQTRCLCQRRDYPQRCEGHSLHAAFAGSDKISCGDCRLAAADQVLDNLPMSTLDVVGWVRRTFAVCCMHPVGSNFCLITATHCMLLCCSGG